MALFLGIFRPNMWKIMLAEANTFLSIHSEFVSQVEAGGSLPENRQIGLARLEAVLMFHFQLQNSLVKHLLVGSPAFRQYILRDNKGGICMVAQA